MKKKMNLINKIISLMLCLTMIIPFMPTITIAANGNVEIEETISKYDSNILVYTSNSNHGRVAKTGEGNDYRIYEIDHVYTGYAFSHWEVYFTGDYKGGSLTNEDDIKDEATYFFSDASNTSKKYDKYSDSVRVNISSDAEGTYYVRAVFMEGYSVSVSIDEQTNNAPEGGANFLIRDLNSDKEEVGLQSVNWVVAKNTEIQISAMTTTMYNTLLDKIYINGVDKTDVYTPYKANNTWYVNIYFGWPAQEEQYLSGIQSNIDIKITTKPMEYIVNFHGNGATSNDDMESQMFIYKQEQAINKNTFEREGYIFTGWNTMSDGTGDFYNDEQKIAMGTYMEAMGGEAPYITDLYAQWDLPMATYTAPTAKKLTYNTQPQELVSAGVTTEGMMVYSLEENGIYTETIPTATNVNTYKVWYYVKGDNSHNDSTKEFVDVKIEKADPEIGIVSARDVNDSTDIAEIVLERTNNTIDGNLLVDAGQTLNLGENKIKYTFTPNDTSNYNTINDEVIVVVKDTISPIGTVTITDAKTIWDRVLEKITFGLYFNSDQEIIVQATDSFSGVEKIEYYETADVLNLDEVKALTDDKWTEMDDRVVVSVEDAKQFIYYIRITDKSGNINYIATDGAEFDTTAPAITGVDDNKNYYTSQKIIVTDKNLDIVTLNGEPVTDTIIIDGDKDETYIIKATDKIGNTTTLSVTMKRIENVGIPIEGITQDNVKDTDRDSIQVVIDKVNELLKDEDTTDEEKVALENIKARAEALIKQIEKLNKGNNPQTGDNINLFIVMLVVSVIGIMLTTKFRKKYNND